MRKRASILEKTSERQIKLSLLLGMAPMDCTRLAEQLEITKKTLLTDVLFFNHTYSPASIEIDQYQIATLSLPYDVNLEDLIKQILSQSTNVQILQAIFIEELSLANLANKLFLSETSIRRIIANINNYFEEKNFPMTILISAKLQITGNEDYIRQFFCSLFREQYTPQKLPHFQQIFEVLQRYYKKQRQPVSISTYKLVLNSYYLYTSIIRVGQGHLAPYNSANKTEKDCLFFHLFKEHTVFCSMIEKQYHFTVTKENVHNLMTSDILFPYSITENQDSEKHQCIKNLAHHFYHCLSLDFSLSKNDLQQLSEFIHYNKNLQIFKTSYIHILSEILMTHSPKLLNAYKEAIEQSGLIEISDNQLLYEELLLELIALSPELLTTVFPYKKQLSILIVSYHEEHILTFYKQLLLKKLPALHTIHTYNENIFQIHYEQLNQYDLVLTDIELNQMKTSAKIIKISKIPTTAFWNNLESIIYV
ncbi:hypothetical protein A5844_002690 [Enterococcus sp. 10A9_DIV0425]|uniref:Mga helix-turn-helix domain-containing protein n=1 Tax=Candidatus Enterococcus wittei TaxID=1987383 RepID=A0A242JVR2_9ENTE|nr:helix-turn-helix domain-containing protein [Enterococcus sp. 10A9_DIV0425]OTP06984.1 hypothetical protein A5844_002690 [Enterococcus sp. 10A9_DIV0425]